MSVLEFMSEYQPFYRQTSPRVPEKEPSLDDAESARIYEENHDMEKQPWKRIIICCDGTYDDFGDTPERTRPGSSVSRILRWLLPPLAYHILWLLGIFAVIKFVEILILGPKEPRQPLRSNVSRLASYILPYSKEKDEEGNTIYVQQLVFYIGGVGALGTPQSRVEEAVTGNTMSYKVRYAYRMIIDNYSPGDEICLFGFSRGAFTVRALAGFIKWAGILRKVNMDFFDLIWHEYVKPIKSGEERLSRTEILQKVMLQYRHRDTGEGEKSGSKELGDTSSHNCEQAEPEVTIKCIGVWDTVGSLGPPPLWVPTIDDEKLASLSALRHGPFDVSLGPYTKHVFQALALDECRFDFYPAVLQGPCDDQVFSQTWFPGVHGDLGGGMRKYIGDYPLVWMVSKIVHHGLIGLDEAYIEEDVLKSLKSNPTAYPNRVTIGPRDWFDRSWLAYHFLPSFLNTRLAFRNPHLPAGKALRSNKSEGPEDGDETLQSTIAREQRFHWTVLRRIEGTDDSYWEAKHAGIPVTRRLAWTFSWLLGRSSTGQLGEDLSLLRSKDACRALRRPSPCNHNVQITKEMIRERMDDAVGFDQYLRDFFDTI